MFLRKLSPMNQTFWKSIVVVVSYLVHYDTLLQNATDIITKYDSFFITKCGSFIIKCDSYYKIRQYNLYGLGLSLENSSISRDLLLGITTI